MKILSYPAMQVQWAQYTDPLAFSKYTQDSWGLSLALCDAVTFVFNAIYGHWPSI